MFLPKVKFFTKYGLKDFFNLEEIYKKKLATLSFVLSSELSNFSFFYSMYYQRKSANDAITN